MIAELPNFSLLSAAGSTSSQPELRYARVMGMKKAPVRDVDGRLAIFRPGIILGNAHTPAWVGWFRSLVPGSFGNIDQRILGRSIATEIGFPQIKRQVKITGKMGR